MNEAVLRHRDGAVQVLSINDPAARNGVTHELCAALPAALAEAQADPGIGAIVLTGVGNAFGAGGDLDRYVQRTTPPLERRAGIERLYGLIRSIHGCSKPVIAALEGAAAGAGLSIALACDVVVAARNTSFPAAYVKIGPSSGGRATSLLSDLVLRRVLTEPGLAGTRVTAERMHGLGVVNRLSEPGSALTEAIAMAVTFASGPQRLIVHIKTLCRHAGENTLEMQLELEDRHEMESVTLH